MKIEKTPTKLTIYNAPWGAWLFIALLPIIGLLMILMCFQAYSLVCSRTGKTANVCETSHFTFFRTIKQQLPLNQLKEARIQESTSDQSKVRTIVLVTDVEVIEFGVKDFSQFDKQENVSKINTFLQNPEQLSLSVKSQNLRIDLLFFGIIWSLIAWFLFFCVCQVTTLTLDKKLETLKLKRQGLLGTKIVERPLKEVVNVSRDSKSVGVYLLLRPFNLVEAYNDLNLKPMAKNADKVVREIREFLDLP